MFLFDIKVTGAAVAGFASHWGYFLHGEHHKSAPTLAYIYLLLVPTIFLCQIYLTNLSPFLAFQEAFSITTAYTAALFTSMSIYRIFFHRIRSFPGPLLACTTKLWHSWKARNGGNHVYLESLHRKYGTFVRTGKLRAPFP